MYFNKYYYSLYNINIYIYNMLNIYNKNNLLLIGGVASLNILFDINYINYLGKKFKFPYMNIDLSLLRNDKSLREAIYNFLPKGIKNKTNIIMLRLHITEVGNDLPKYPLDITFLLNMNANLLYNFISKLLYNAKNIYVEITLKNK